MRIADAAALRALDDPGAEAAEADADARLARLGIDANGWRCAFAHAAGLHRRPEPASSPYLFGCGVTRR